MSPSRRDFFAILAGGAVSLAASSDTVATAPQSAYGRVIAARDILRSVQHSFGSQSREADALEAVNGALEAVILRHLCPHDPATYDHEATEWEGFDYVDNEPCMVRGHSVRCSACDACAWRMKRNEGN